MSALRKRCGGQSAVEYLIGVSLLALAITVGPDSPLERLQQGFRGAWVGFTYAVAMP